ncbi:MAG TPA: FeoB-associated Cys-rich membrane protein [Ruminococcus sp.]|nr:FeoB-associated Cys-rich membrane protein [Ruminococcus sp.]HOO05096.1 FeoB-associated Cys-rich membrane protein [Ruminococcus sp.]
MKAVDVILLIIVCAALSLAVVSVIRQKKSGNGCCGSCQGCSKKDSCGGTHSNE